MPEHVKTIPIATKFHEMIRRKSAPTSMTAWSSVKKAMNMPGRS